jgi:hypothetical protein
MEILMNHLRIRAVCLGLLCLTGLPVAARAQDDGDGSMSVSDRSGGGDNTVIFSLHDIGSIRFVPCDEIIVRLRDGSERHFDLGTYGTLKFVPCDRNPFGGRMEPSAVPGAPGAPAGLAVTLFPNPTSSSLVIEIASDRDDRASVVVYDLSGNTVWSREGVEIGPGATRVVWSGANAAGERVHSGTYVVRVTASGRESTQSVSVTK